MVDSAREFDGAQDYDFILRCTEEAEKIAHVHQVLYHWRTHEKSTSDNPESKIYAFHAGRRAVEAHLQRLGIQAEVEETCDLGYYGGMISGDWQSDGVDPDPEQGSAAERFEKCLKSIWEKTEYTNYEILIIENNRLQKKKRLSFIKKLMADIMFVCFTGIRNLIILLLIIPGATQAKGEYLLLLNNDTEVITKGWMKELLSHCQRPEVGMVGAKLYFPDNTIQSAGTIIGMGGMADHCSCSIWTGRSRDICTGHPFRWI